ncbi:hypothetical protein EOM86_11945 [Candidatus Nomurabacteria bacterium]|nr:hypothetical protein [Candidatus Nomurabacteria bacterium]
MNIFAKTTNDVLIEVEKPNHYQLRNGLEVRDVINAFLNKTSDRREIMVLGRCSHNDQLNITRLYFRFIQSFLCGRHRHITSAFAFSRDTTFFNACSRRYPLVRSVDKLFKITIGKFSFGKVMP